jgi:hypothetical protein
MQAIFFGSLGKMSRWTASISTRMELSLRCPTRRSSTSSTDEARPHNERNGPLATVNALKPDHSVGPVPAQPCLRPVLREPLWRTLEMLQQPKGRRRSAGKRIHALQIGRTTQGPVPQEDISPWRVFAPLRHDPSPCPSCSQRGFSERSTRAF